MKNQLKPNQMDFEVNDIDFNRLCQVAKKVQVFLFRKLDNPIEIYLLLKVLCFSIEDTFGFCLDIDEEQKFKQMFS